LQEFRSNAISQDNKCVVTIIIIIIIIIIITESCSCVYCISYQQLRLFSVNCVIVLNI